MHRKQTKGFTLVELIVVIAILAILAAAAIVGFGAVTAQARASRLHNNAEALVKALGHYNSLANSPLTGGNLFGDHGSALLSSDNTTILLHLDAKDANTGTEQDFSLDCRRAKDAEWAMKAIVWNSNSWVCDDQAISDWGGKGEFGGAVNIEPEAGE